MTKTPSSSRPNWTFLWGALWLTGLLLVTLLAAAVRLHEVQHSLWLDELHTAWCVDGPLDQVASRAQRGNTSPLYFWIVWAVAQSLGGLTEWSLRLPSLTAGIALAPVAGVFTSQLTRSRAAGLLAAVLVAVDLPSAYFSQEARAYALVQLCGLLHVWTFWRLVERPALGSQVLLVLLTVALFYLHYTGLLLLVGELTWYLWRWSYHRRRASPADSAEEVQQAIASPLRVLGVLAVAAVGCLPALGHLAAVAARREMWAAVAPAPTVQEVWKILDIFPAWQYWLAPALAGAIACWVASLFRSRRAAARHRELLPAMTLVICWYLAPVTAAWLAAWSGAAHLLLSRYLIVSATALPIGAAVFCAALPGATARAGFLLALVLIALLHGEPTVWHGSQQVALGHYTEDWRGAVQFIRQEDGAKRRPVFLAPRLVEEQLLAAPQADGRLVEYLKFPVSSIYNLRQGRDVEILTPQIPGRILSPRQANLARDAGGGWLLLRGAQGHIKDWQADLNQQGWEIKKSPPLHGLEAALLTPREESRPVQETP